MLSPAQLDLLTGPVAQRAFAAEQGLEGFRDRAAKFVLERLGLLASREMDGPNCQSCRGHILCSKWIDNQLVNFFQRNPRAQGIEVGGGLSTRFHRISDQLDWPQFSWQCINQPEIDDCVNYVFPQIENYRCIGSIAPEKHWSTYVGWQHAEGVVIVIGENNPLSDEFELNLLIENLKKSLQQKPSDLHCIVSHNFHNLVERVALLLPNAHCRAQFSTSCCNTSFLSRVNPFKNRQNPHHSPRTIDYLVLRNY